MPLEPLNEAEEKFLEDGTMPPEAPVDDPVGEEAAPEDIDAAEAGADADADAAPAEGERPRDPKTGKFVPVAKYVEDRKKHAAQIDQLRQQLAHAQGQLAAQQPRQAGQEQSQRPAPPDPDKDIFGAYRYTAQRVEQLERHLVEQYQRATQAQQVQQLAQAAEAAFAQDSAAYAAEDPQFNDAAAFAVAVRDRLLQADGITDPNRRRQIMRNDLLQITIQERQGGRNAAAKLVEYAKAYGWQPGMGQTQAPAPAGNELANRLKSVAQTQQQARSLSAAGGRAGNGAGVTMDEFHSWPKSKQDAFMAKPGGMAQVEKWLAGV